VVKAIEFVNELPEIPDWKLKRKAFRKLEHERKDKHLISNKPGWK
jgi:acyl-coenzyme A synthetase/AMP-(fatty) acid ligase